MAIQAYVFITTTNPGPRAACQTIRQLAGVVRADALFGGPPVIALIEAADLFALDMIIDQIVALPVVTDTESHVVRPIE